MIPSDQRLPPRCDDPCQIAPSTQPTTVPKVIVYKFCSEPKIEFSYWKCVSSWVSKGRDVKLLLCPGTRAGVKILGLTPLSIDIQGQNHFLKTKNRKRTF